MWKPLGEGFPCRLLCHLPARVVHGLVWGRCGDGKGGAHGPSSARQGCWYMMRLELEALISILRESLVVVAAASRGSEFHVQLLSINLGCQLIKPKTAF